MKKFLILSGIIAAAVFLFFFKAAHIPLWSSDEGRFGEIGREMLERGRLIVPSFNYVDYIEKPILAPLMASAAFAVFGVHSLCARLPSMLAALLGLLLTFACARRLFNFRTAVLSVLILMTSVGYVLVGRFAVIDMVLTLLLSAALFSLMIAFFEEKRGYYLLAYALIGVAFLTKGLLAVVIPGLVFLVFLVWARRLDEILRMHLFWGVLIFLALVAPWVYAITLKEPEFFEVFLVKHHLARFATGSLGRSRPFWFYLPILLAVAFPWSFFIPAAFRHSLKHAGEDRRKLGFLAVWVIASFCFFSMSRAKLPYYILPVSVPLAVFIAHFMNSLLLRRENQDQGAAAFSLWTWRVLGGLGLAAALAIEGYQFFYPHYSEMLGTLSGPLHGGAVSFLGIAAAAFLYIKGKPAAAFGTLCAAVYGVLVLTAVGMVRISPWQSTYGEAAIIRQFGAEGDTVAIFSSPDHFSDMPFHLRRRIQVVGSDRGTLSQESGESEDRAEMAKWFVPLEPFLQNFASATNRIFLLLDEDRYQELRDRGLKDHTVLRRAFNKVLICNQNPGPAV